MPSSAAASGCQFRSGDVVDNTGECVSVYVCADRFMISAGGETCARDGGVSAIEEFLFDLNPCLFLFSIKFSKEVIIYFFFTQVHIGLGVWVGGFHGS